MSSHGHVTPRDDGAKARCGGPGICTDCALEYARLHYKAEPAPPEPEPQYPTICDHPVERMTLEELVSELNQLNNLGDAIYKVRSRAIEGEYWGPYEGDSWKHPAVLRYQTLLRAIGFSLERACVPTIGG